MKKRNQDSRMEKKKTIAGKTLFEPRFIAAFCDDEKEFRISVTPQSMVLK